MAMPQPAADDHRIVGQQQPEREGRHQHRRPGQIGKQPRTLGQPGQEQIGWQRQQPAQRQPDQPTDQRQRTKQHRVVITDKNVRSKIGHKFGIPMRLHVFR